ncbi:MAG: UbiA family prenyltransferase [Clostridia bacterium]
MLSRFLSYVEIKTKITSAFAFLLSLAYLFYIGQPVDWHRTLVFFASMFLFDLTTTALNNYIDTKTNHQTLQFRRPAALAIFFILLALSIASGLYLFHLTDIVVLLAGGLCFATGILYTFGPLPISRLPLGEVMSGLFYGFFIPFLILYINMPAGTYLTLGLIQPGPAVSLTLNLLPLATVVLLAAAPVFTTANIMLANNICDLEKDIAVKRHTLPYYIGGRALTLFAWTYYAVYVVDIAMVAAGMLHPLVLASLVTLIPVWKNINKFRKTQDKQTTFHVSIINYVVIMGSHTLLIFLSGFIGG